MGKEQLLLIPMLMLQVGQHQGWKRRSPKPKLALWSQTIGLDLRRE